jgi:hypothetical protein
LNKLRNEVAHGREKNDWNVLSFYHYFKPQFILRPAPACMRLRFVLCCHHKHNKPVDFLHVLELERELELIQTQTAQKPMQRAEVYAHRWFSSCVSNPNIIP